MSTFCSGGKPAGGVSGVAGGASMGCGIGTWAKTDENGFIKAIPRVKANKVRFFFIIFPYSN